MYPIFYFRSTYEFIDFCSINSSDPKSYKQKCCNWRITGIHCRYCPDGHARVNAIVEANPGRVVAVNIHAGWYATPKAGELDLRINNGSALAAWL